MKKTEMKIKWKNEDLPHMQVREKDGVTWLSYPAFEVIPGVLHGFSTRLGGVSEGIFSSMNLSFIRGDDRDAVMENYRRIGQAIGFIPEQVVCSDQTHTVTVRRVTAEDKGRGIFRERGYTDVDGLITNDPGVVLATFYADCVPLFFVDPVKKAIGLSHSGWRGTVGKIGKVTVEKMTEEFGSDPADLYAAVGPSICQDCYEVSEDVALQFKEIFPEEDHSLLLLEKGGGKYQLNLWKANACIFLEAGIRKERILMPGICTCCNPEFLFSHRASKGKRGNLAAFLGLTGRNA